MPKKLENRVKTYKSSRYLLYLNIVLLWWYSQKLFKIMENHIELALKNIVIPEHILVAIFGELIVGWKKSGIHEIEEYAKALEGQFDTSLEYRQKIKIIILEASAISNLILTLKKEYPFKQEIISLYPTKKDKALNFLKKEITSRSVMMNGSVGAMSNLPKPLIKQRLTEYLSI